MAEPVKVKFRYQEKKSVTTRREHVSSKKRNVSYPVTDIGKSDSCISYLLSEIERRKVYPVTEQEMSHEADVSMRIVVNTDGTLKKIIITNSGPYKGITNAAIQAVKSAAPFKKLQDFGLDREIEMKFTMKFSLE